MNTDSDLIVIQSQMRWVLTELFDQLRMKWTEEPAEYYAFLKETTSDYSEVRMQQEREVTRGN